ncbi:MAG: 3,4-dihydroxy-2-butanone-4-phosphate synthase [Enterocloster clostridioformis]
MTDDESRENEGDLYLRRPICHHGKREFMAVHGRGLICMPMSTQLCTRLKFPQMVSDNSDNHETAFTVSIDHISTSTGISRGRDGA